MTINILSNSAIIGRCINSCFLISEIVNSDHFISEKTDLLNRYHVTFVVVALPPIRNDDGMAVSLDMALPTK